MLEQCKRCFLLSWPTIMGHYKLFIATFTALDTIWCWSVAAVIPNCTSSGHLRRCSDADTTNQCLSSGIYPSILSWQTIMGHQKLLSAICTA
eukprot:scaffold27871_cov172-Skeletonema_marinoi.AAC.2